MTGCAVEWKQSRGAGMAQSTRAPGPLMLPVDDGGTGGLTIVFLHALGGAASQWSAQLAHLRTARRAIAVTLRGHPGAPSPRSRDFRITTLAADVAHTLDALSVDRCALVGHSIGAHVALALAAQWTDRVSGVLLADSAVDMRRLPALEVDALLHGLQSDDYVAAIERQFRRLLVGSRTAVAERVLADLRATPRASVVGVMRADREFDPVAALAAYPGPVLAVDSHLADQPCSLHRLCPDLRRARLGDTGHWLQLDRPGEFNLLLDGWVGALNPSRRVATAHPPH
jgi:pimeloyl-ACP methyl ester carboxylesterase